MVFSGLTFLYGFLVVTLLVYFILPRKFKNGWLLLTSLFFYGYGEPIYLLLMVSSIAVNYCLGLLIGSGKKKKLFLATGIVINLALLSYFKYAGFFTNTLLSLFPSLKGMIVIPEIALPIGISFYTFQTMSYLIDVYRNDTGAQKNIVKFGTYVTMFPQLIAGPIVRYKDIEYQLENRKENAEIFSNGVRLFVLGLAKKVLLANALGELFGRLTSAEGSGTLGHWLALIAFSLQIYFDFSGYSDMARGLGNMFGFSFLKNFDFPYISKSVSEFWRRWHMSLGTWFREYVYIPLGGNRHGAVRTCINLLIVWALTGLWHGASWNFVLWGLYYGILLIIEKLFLGKCLKKCPPIIAHIYTLFLVGIGWMLFTFTDMNELLTFLPGLFRWAAPSAEALSSILAYLPVLLAGIFACLPTTRKIWERLKDKKHFILLEAAIVVLLMLLCTAALVTSTYNPFLYFRF